MRGGIERSPKYYFDYSHITPELLASARPVEGVTEISDRDVRATDPTLAQSRWVHVSSTRS